MVPTKGIKADIFVRRRRAHGDGRQTKERIRTGGVAEGFLHAGGVLQDSSLPRQSCEGIRSVFAPKVKGAAALLSCTPLTPLRAVSYFTSIASLFGSRGQTNYAAANAVLDAWAGQQQLSV